MHREARNLLVNEYVASRSEILEHHDWTFPVPIRYGPGRLEEIGQACTDLGISRVLIVTDRGSRQLPFVDRLRDCLETSDIAFDLFSDISPNPRDDETRSGRTMFRSGGHEAVIAIGGGSAMDGGKSICLTANNELDLWDFEYESDSPSIGNGKPFPRLICVPTTAGTGAETESTAMVTRTNTGMKLCVWHPELKPSLAILDPELTVGLPADLTAWTGADALTHAIEAYCVPGFHPLCDGLALEALSLIANFLRIAAREPEDIVARGGMLVGSCLGGISFLKGLGLVHAISHMIGAEFDTQHGLTNAIVLPVVLKFNLPGMETKVERMSEAMGLRSRSVEGFIGEINGLLDNLEIPRSLEEIGVPLECARRIGKKSLLDSAAGTNPRNANLGEVTKLIETAISGARQ